MDVRAIDRLATRFGLAGVVVTALPVILGDGPADTALRVVWWIAYVVFVAALVFDMWRPAGLLLWVSFRANLAVLVLSAAVAVLVFPLGATPVLMVVSAVYGAFLLPPKATRNLIIGQLVVIGLGTFIATDAAEAFLLVAVYGAFQAFAALMVHSRRSEATAREELAAAHTELRASSALLAESSRTAERLRIARDLHDVVGHQLTALSLELEVATHKDADDGRVHVVKARDIAKDLLEDVRSAVGELRVHSPGLERPLRALVDGLTQVDIDLTVREDVDVDDERVMVVVRCIQEIVTNTLRHADATRLSIDVAADHSGVTVSARDNGHGADDIRPGHGLVGMRERVEGCGGRLAVNSGDGRGFAVETWIPAA